MARTLCYHCMREGVENGVCVFCKKRPTRYDPRAGELALPPGTELDGGNIIVGECLGSGGFGITYIALDKTKNRRIALKEFAPRHMLAGREGKNLVVRSDMRAAYEKSLHSFLKESRLLVALRHPNIVQVFFEMDENGTGYYGMELLEGEDLGQYVRRRGVLNPIDAYKLLEPIMDALIYMHSTGSGGTFHRDISPDNIYLRRDGVPCLIDFGAASTTIQGFSVSHPNVRKNGYSPLEQNWDSSEQGAHTDVYAFAATLYYVMSGNVPVPSNDRMAAVSSNRGGTGLTPLSRLNPNVTPQLERVIQKGLALLPDGRYQTMRDFKEAMRVAIFEPQNSVEAVRQFTGPQAGPPEELRVTEGSQVWPVAIQSSMRSTEGSHAQTSMKERSRSAGNLFAMLLDLAVFVGLPTLVGSVLGQPWLCGGIGAALMLIVNTVCCMRGGGTLFQRILGCNLPQLRLGNSVLYNALRMVQPLALVDEIIALICKCRSVLERICGVSFTRAVQAQSAPEVPRASAKQEGPLSASSGHVTPGSLEPPRKLHFLRCIEGEYKGRRFVLDQEHCFGRDKRFTTITFSKECTLVSNRHCVLHHAGDGWRVEDLNATNGTFINDVRLPSGGFSEKLKKGDRLRVGNEVFVYEDD